MIVIAETSPINYLVLIEQIEALPKLYGRILVPPSVCEELKRVRTPEVVRLWIADPPSWLEIVAPKQAPDSELIKTDLDPASATPTSVRL